MRSQISSTLLTLSALAFLASAQYGYCTTSTQAGECISTSSCAAAGGTSDPANLCPGSDDIQCCTWGSCTNSAGLAGQCVPTSACSSAGGSSDPGNFCPGSQDVQCCSYGTCTNSAGTAGICQPVSSCSGSSDSGNFCPGDESIQCCSSSSGGSNPPPPTGCGVPEVNDATLTLLKDSESPQCSTTPYTDPTGNPTIGYGHLCDDSSCSDVSYSVPLSQDDCDNLLQDDLVEYTTCTANAFTDAIVFNDNQFGAFVDFVYNEGCGIVNDSPFTRINDGEDPNTVVEEEFPKYVYASGEELPGLVTRRQNEIDLFETSSSTGALPYTPC